MNLFDDIIKQELALLEGFTPKRLDYVKGWADDGNNGIILRSDMAYELGGDNIPAVSDTTMTEIYDYVDGNELLLYGPDLPEIKKDSPYARLVFLKTKENSFSQDNLYNEVTKITFAKYHVHPHGFMPRISSANHREPVRVSKDSLKDGLNFAKVASMYQDEYLKNPRVEAAKIIFITDPAFPYAELERLSIKSGMIISALDQVLKNLLMDCHTCKLKPVCDEVEGIKELHFNATKGEK